MKMSPVVHFEMPYDDRQRMVDFYAKVFGWQAQLFGPDMGDYAVVMTTEVDETTQMPKEPGRINGGLFKRSPESSDLTFVIGVEDIRQAMTEIEAAGGKLKQAEPDPIPGVGQYIAFTDTEGNRVAVLQPEPPGQQPS